MCVLTFLWLFPFAWAFLSSLKSATELATGGFGLPREWRWDNYATAFERMRYLRALLNSLIYAGGAALLQCVTCSLAAFALARMRFPGRELLFVLALATLMIPGTVTLTANFVILHKLGWLNTFLALVIPNGASGFAIFLLRQFFMSIPRELEDAATIDGAGPLRFLIHVAIPLSRAALVTVLIFVFISEYNQFLWPLIMTSTADMRVTQVALTMFNDELGTGLNQGPLMAAAVLTLLPTVVLFIFLQRAFVRGITQTGLKG
jgi:multiple sugar transport system permease protein